MSSPMFSFSARSLDWRAASLAVAIGAAVLGLASSVALALVIGSPLADVTPWAWLDHVAQHGVTDVATRALAMGGVLTVLAPLALWALAPRRTDLGQARFATGGEVRASGLLARSGILLGRYGRQYLRSDEPLHVLVAAPTRSGKGVGIVIPNLLSWPGSALVLDIKYENHELTSGFRAAHGQAVYRFSPGDPDGRSHRYNPLDAIRPGLAHRVSDSQRLAAILLPVPQGMKDSFWIDEARSLFLGLVLCVLDTPQSPHTLGEIYRTLMGPEPLHERLTYLLETRDDLDPVCVSALGSFVQKAEKERSGVRSTLTAALSLWANPVIDAATSASDFDLAELRRRPTTIYVAVSLDQLQSLARLLNLFFQQAISLLAQALPRDDEPYPVLMLLDEFASLGRMDVLRDSLAFLAGFRVRICTIVQGLGQLDDLYGRAGRESILQNSALQVLFAANDELTARYLSDRLGTQTIRTVSESPSRGSVLRSRSYAFAGRALMLPEEVRQLGADEALILKEGAHPVRARKIRFYADPAFAARRASPAEVPELVISEGARRERRAGGDLERGSRWSEPYAPEVEAILSAQERVLGARARRALRAGCTS